MKHRKHVPNSGPGPGRHDPDGGRECRQRCFPGFVEQAFAGESRLELFGTPAAGAPIPFGLNPVQDDLILSSWLIDG